MRTTRIVLFATLAAVIAASVALAMVSNVTRGPASHFPAGSDVTGTSSELSSDAAAIVRRLQSLGYADSQSRANGELDRSDLVRIRPEGACGTLRCACRRELQVQAGRVRSSSVHRDHRRWPATRSLPRLTNTCLRTEVFAYGGALQVDPETGLPVGHVPLTRRWRSR